MKSCSRLISFEEFQAFEGRLCVPDALYRTAFQLFDTNGNGTVSFGRLASQTDSRLQQNKNLPFADEFSQIIKQTTLHKSFPFPFDSDFCKLYFGRKKNRNVTYAEFSQFLHDFHEEYANVAFRSKDPEGSGFVSAGDFLSIMVTIKGHLLTEPVGGLDFAHSQWI